MRQFVHLLIASLLLIFTACSDADKTSAVNSDKHVAASAADASAFLSRATFGATSDEIKRLYEKKMSYEKWLDEQFGIPATYHMEWAETNVKGIGSTPDIKDSPEDWKTHSDTTGYLQRDIWWHIAVNAKDQLRQRVALALSEIFVISKFGPLATMPDSRISYYDILIKNAFGNFETLLKDVTYHPAMGRYLSYLGNAKSDDTGTRHPDENYAREVMQLFTIGLYELNPDGTQKKDSGGRAIPTYSQKDIKQMAKVFTGLTDRNGFFFASDGSTSHSSRTEPMIPFEEYHDHSEKTVLGHTLPSGRDTETDIDSALHLLFMHENTGPFIARRLIQRLVTSNPSPDYIRRVTSAFNDNGSGVRGDMKAVIKAVLLDDEAINGAKKMPESFGKFREPLLFVTNLFRAFGAKGKINTLNIYDGGPSYRYLSYHFHGTGMTRQEAPLEALTVFNYFTPEDGPYSLKKNGLVAPESELYGKGGIDDVLMGLITKNGFVYRLYKVTAELDIDTEKAMIEAKEYGKLVDYLDTLLTGSNMSYESKNAVVSYLKTHENTLDDEGKPLSSDKLTRFAIGLVMTSPDYALQR